MLSFAGSDLERFCVRCSVAIFSTQVVCSNKFLKGMISLLILGVAQRKSNYPLRVLFPTSSSSAAKHTLNLFS